MTSHYVLKIQYVNKPPETRNIGARVTTLGREAGDIILGDPQSSGRHAEIYFENGNVRVKDLGSTNGTFFNGQRSPEFTLQPGSGFSIGQTVMTLMAVHAGQQRPGAGKTMLAMGGVPRPPGFAAPPPPGAPPGVPPGPPGGFGAPPPPPGAPPGGFGAPPPPPGAPPGGFGGPPPGAPPGGFGAPPPGAPPPGAPPPPSSPPMAAAPVSSPPMGAPPMGAPMGAPMAMGGPPPGPPAYGQAQPAPPMSAMPGGEVRGDFSGTGGELLGQLLVGYLLTLVTIGIYLPWFMCKFTNFIAERITFGPTAKGTVRFRFEGEGGKLFVTFLVGYLLTLVTIGIYAPWFMCKLTKFFADNTTAMTDDGSQYKPSFQGTGGDLFVTFLVGYLLTLITIGIYTPWFICKLNKWYAENTKITKNGQEVGNMDFTGEGGELLVTFIVGYLLTLVTLGFYMFWFQVKLMKFNADHTKINVEGQRLGLRFTGEGGELFVILFIGYLLSIVTLGIYMFWMFAKLLKWRYSNTIVLSEGGAPMAMGAPMGGHVQQIGGPPPGQMMPMGQPQPQLGPQPGYGPPPGGPPPGGYGPPPGGGYGGPPGGGYGGPPGGGYA